MKLVPQISPELLVRSVDDQFAYAVNCSYPNSFRLLNRRQQEILQAVNGRDDIEAIADRLKLQPDALHQYFLMLGKTELISFNGFTVPQKPLVTRSLNFWIHTTNACNLSCSYCYISTLNTGKGMTSEVRRQLLYKLLEAVQQKGVRQIRLRLAGGEPLGQFAAWKSFIPEAKRTLSDAGCQLDIGFITNLTLLNDDIIAFSKEYHIGYGVSLDGIADMHDATRSFRSGCGSFNILDDNLRKLIAADIPVSVTTVLTNLNLIGLPALTRYLIDLDIPFRYSIVKGEAINAELLNECLSASYDLMQEAIAKGWQFSKRYQFCDLKPNDLGFQTCASGFSGGAIYTDGTLKYCQVQFGDKAPAPSIFDESNLVDLIAAGEHPEAHKSDDCKKCCYRFVCTSGCPVYRVKGKDPQCSLYHQFIPKYYELQARERMALLNQPV